MHWNWFCKRSQSFKNEIVWMCWDLLGNILQRFFFRRLKAKITETKGQEAADAFAKKAQTCVKEVLGNFKNYDFYLGKCSTLENLDGNYYLM